MRRSVNRYFIWVLFGLFLIFLPSHVFANRNILVINSNGNVGKYRLVQTEFTKAVSTPVFAIDLKGKIKMTGEIQETIQKANASLVYCIGGKAYSFAGKHLRGHTIIFSSILNWLRLPRSSKTYGISNELHTRMQLYMFRSVFPKIRKIGILYSRQFTLEWFQDAEKQAEELGIDLEGRMVTDKKQTTAMLKKLLPDADAFWLISDPLVMPRKKSLIDILRICDKRQKPVFSYHGAFAHLGAVLIVSADNPTIGKQAADVALTLLSGGEITDKVNPPAGSHITLNLKKVEEYNLQYNSNALGLVNKVLK